MRASLLLFALLPATALLSAARPTTPASSTLATAPDQFVRIADARLRYRDIGSGAPVVLLHGYADRLEMWEMVADSLAQKHRVIALDQRGFGLSTKFSDPAKYGVHVVDDVIALLDSLHIPRAHLVGHSMGGLVAANVALRHPCRVATATIVAGAFLGDSLGADSASVGAAIAPWIQDLERGRGLRGLILWLQPWLTDSAAAAASDVALRDNDRGALTAAMRALPALSISAAAENTAQVPALFLIGSDDPMLAANRAHARAWPSARMLILPGADHDAVATSPVLVRALRAQLMSRQPNAAVCVGA
jgi:pimeloyl-ACP methyl ester carboxylesterase